MKSTAYITAATSDLMVMGRGRAFVDTATSGELIITTMEMPRANGVDHH